MPQIECIAETTNVLGESPIWSMSDSKLYWVDSRGPTVFRLDPVTGTIEERRISEVIGSIGFRAAGGLIIAIQSGIHFYDFDTDILTPLVDPEADQPENRFNDGRCDRAGRFWCGTMNDARRDPTGSLYCIEPGGEVAVIRDDIVVPNSLCWSPDDMVMYFADTYRDVIYAFDFSITDGAVSNERVFADTSMGQGRPDGSAVDADGYVWNAVYGGHRLVRYAPDGRIDREVPMPIWNPTCCCFGGPGLDILYVTSATQRLSESDLAQQPQAGGVFAIDVGVGGLPEAAFAG